MKHMGGTQYTTQFVLEDGVLHTLMMYESEDHDYVEAYLWRLPCTYVFSFRIVSMKLLNDIRLGIYPQGSKHVGSYFFNPFYNNNRVITNIKDLLNNRKYIRAALILLKDLLGKTDKGQEWIDGVVVELLDRIWRPGTKKNNDGNTIYMSTLDKKMRNVIMGVFAPDCVRELFQL